MREWRSVRRRRHLADKLHGLASGFVEPTARREARATTVIRFRPAVAGLQRDK
jgi:hypothetical protein